MKALFCRWNGCAEKGILHAFERLGVTVQSIFYNFETADYSDECLELLNRELGQTHYDFVFSHNYIPIVSRVCNIYRIPYISWVMDSPAYHLYSNSVQNPYNYIFIFDSVLYQQFVSQNPDHIFYHPLATCINDWDQTRSIPHPSRDYQCDVSFLGSMYVREAHYDEVTGLSPELKGYMEGLMDAQLQVYGYNFLEEVLTEARADEFAAAANWDHAEDYLYDAKGVVSQIYLGQKITQKERFKLINAITSDKLHFKLYTNSELPEHLSPYNQGTADYYTEMPFIFRESKINLNITSKSIRSGLPLRLFDIMGCGGFLLTNYQSELPDYFKIGEDLIAYESVPHAIELIHYYLQHEDERLAIAEHGYQTVKHNFSYEMALMDMLEQVFKG